MQQKCNCISKPVLSIPPRVQRCYLIYCDSVKWHSSARISRGFSFNKYSILPNSLVIHLFSSPPYNPLTAALDLLRPRARGCAGLCHPRGSLRSERGSGEVTEVLTYLTWTQWSSSTSTLAGDNLIIIGQKLRRLQIISDCYVTMATVIFTMLPSPLHTGAEERRPFILMSSSL